MDPNIPNLFAQLVREQNIDQFDLEGRIAYAEYKHKKRLFYNAYQEEHESRLAKLMSEVG